MSEIGTEKPLTRKQAAQHMQITAEKFSKLIREGLIPKDYVHYIGGIGQPRFFASELNKCYLAKSK
jgi:hypothetical protein